MRTAELIIVPFDSAVGDARMGCGPRRLLNGGLIERLSEAGVHCTTREVEPETLHRAEIATASTFIDR